MLAIFSRQPLNTEMLEVLGAFVNQTAIALQNGQLYQHIFESEEKYRSLFENSKDVIYVSSKEGFILDMNPAFMELSGYSREELRSIRAENLYLEPAKRGEFIAAMERQGFVKDYPLVLKRKDGKVLHTLTSAVLQRDRDGNIIAHQGIMRDITAQRRAEEERKTLEEQFRQSQKMEAIGRLAGGIAHDFNNLLTVIAGYSGLALMRLKQGDPLLRHLEEIQKAVERAAALTHQLLAFSRRQIMAPKVVDLNTVIRELTKMLLRIIGEDIELATFLAGDLGGVKVDPGQMEQVIVNLAVNARDAMSAGGKLTIETAKVELDEKYTRNHATVQAGRYVLLAMSDTGTGMTPEVKERLFEPFFTTKERGKGTGLGLSTVYGIVKQSGGNIWVYSELGKGTTFKIYLPQVDEPLEEIKRKEESAEIPRGDETVLLVEDEEEVRKLAALVLQKQGYRVLEAPDAGMALLIYRQHAGGIHLILTDVVMPRMSGPDLIRQLEPLPAGMKVLYMSGYTDNAIVHHGVLDEGIDLIQKPFTPETLARRVREALDGEGC